MNLALKTNINLTKLIKNNKSKKVKEAHISEVYELESGTCQRLYIGQTGRAFSTRISGHKGNARRKEVDVSKYVPMIILRFYIFARRAISLCV